MPLAEIVANWLLPDKNSHPRSLQEPWHQRLGRSRWLWVLFCGHQHGPLPVHLRNDRVRVSRINDSHSLIIIVIVSSLHQRFARSSWFGFSFADSLIRSRRHTKLLPIHLWRKRVCLGIFPAFTNDDHQDDRMFSRVSIHIPIYRLHLPFKTSHSPITRSWKKEHPKYFRIKLYPKTPWHLRKRQRWGP